MNPEKKTEYDGVSDAHFRIDDHAREIEKIKAALGDHEKAATGMVAAVMAIVDQRIHDAVREAAAKVLEDMRAELDRFKREDKAEDRRMIAEAISAALDREERVEKHGTVETPDGVHKMHVVETRKRGG